MQSTIGRSFDFLNAMLSILTHIDPYKRRFSQRQIIVMKSLRLSIRKYRCDTAIPIRST